MWAGNLRVLVVFLVVQVCLLAMLAAPWTVHGRSTNVTVYDHQSLFPWKNKIALSFASTEAMATSSLRAFVVFLFVQVCLLAVMASPWTAEGRPSGDFFPICCWYHRECCYAAHAVAAGEAASPDAQ
ncbi:hypothetical protein ABZP36_016958 [Zizania latifolia]